MAAPTSPIIVFREGPPPKKLTGERLRLLVVQGPNLKTCYCLGGDNITIGREDCVITVNDASVSRKHVELRLVKNQYTVKDLGSANGFIHNNQKVTEAVLHPGDVLIVGLTVFDVLGPGEITRPKIKKPLDAAEVNRRRVEKQKLAKNRLLIIGVVVFLLYLAFSPSEEKKTFREVSKIEEEKDDAPTANKDELKKKLAKKEAEKKEALEGLREFTPDYSVKGDQRKNAEIFFRNGMRELQNKNFRRAISGFETALTVDPSHEMAKRYLKFAKKDFEEEIKSSFMAAKQARASMRYTEARMNYENILRYLEGDQTNPKYVESQEALKQLDKEENKDK